MTYVLVFAVGLIVGWNFLKQPEPVKLWFEKILSRLK